MTSTVRRRAVRLAVLLAVLALLAASCSNGDSDDGEDGSEPGGSTGQSTPEGDDDSGTGAGPTAALLGMEVADPTALTRPALAVKIGNTEQARPQSGIVEADVVVEEKVEGGLTRLAAIFQSEVPAEVGPVRSARATDIPVVFPFGQPLFATSGGNPEVMEAVFQSGLIDVSVDVVPDAYSRRDDRTAPDDLYVATEPLYAEAPETSSAPPTVFAHRPVGVDATDGDEIEGIDIDYGTTQVSFRWDGDVGGWVRSQDGEPHVDEQGRAVAPQNVVVQFADYVDSGQVDSAGATVLRAELTNAEGDVWVLTDGRLIEGTWRKENFTNPSFYLGPDDEPVQLTPGRTWILLPEPGTADRVG